MQGDKVRLGPFTPEHSEIYLGWVNNPSIARQLTRCLPVTSLEHRGWYESCIRRNDAVFFSVTSRTDEVYVGNVWLWSVSNVHRSAELRILLGVDQQKGKGYGTEACELLLQFAFGSLNLNKVYLYVLADNLPARRTFEKAGFSIEGTLGEEFYLDGAYVDALRMSVLRRNWKTL